VEVAATGVDVVDQLHDDNYAGPFAIGFAFPYYDSVYTQLYIGSNGIIGFDTAGMDSRFKTSLPSAGVPNNILAWLWDDLNPDDAANPGAHVYVDTSGGRCVVEFVDYPEYGAGVGEVVTAEVVLEGDGTIRYQYLSIAAGFDAAHCAVGIEDASGTDGLEVAYLTPYLHDSLAVVFSAPPLWLSVAPVTGQVAAGAADTIECLFDATQLDTGVYHGEVLIHSNDPDSVDNPWTVTVELTVTGGYVCGDVDGDGTGPNVADLTYLVDYLFRNGPAPPEPLAADVDGSGGGPNVADLTYLVDYLFRNGPDPTCP